ncbi:Retrovirus-related Pol polyprotein from transposon TNT 1-94 [Cucumis melo var. makuwa]|uniref:Retrovirus-related Pol polyprotein from transposon TNT 1-94 n=1 Tax=Cucumis melo var. makuwa TaxID=1194695 RepID=A0A5D3BL19_CUCMM|nr:Retrovirus-related Pol polyprotein from transposon TNT 1-94 [Cucumis melo var. makuwa]
MKDLGEADVILGVKIRKNKTSLSLCQSHYMEKILKKFDSFDVSPVRTPFDASKHLKKNKGDSLSQPKYAKIIDNVEVNSTSGYVFLLGGGAISWKSAKQTCIARSTMESEFIALELAGQEADKLDGAYNVIVKVRSPSMREFKETKALTRDRAYPKGLNQVLQGVQDLNWCIVKQQRSDGTRFSWVAVNMGGTRTNFNFSASWVAISHGLPSACVAGINISFYVVGRNASPSMLSVETSPSVVGRIARGSPCQ